LIQGNRHLNAINAYNKAINNMSVQISGHLDSGSFFVSLIADRITLSFIFGFSTNIITLIIND
jgi:hypothetical protein